MNMNKGSYQDELDNFFKVLNHLEVAERVVTKGAVSKSRQKLSYQAFIELNAKMASHYYSYFPAISWNGFNLLAIDGSTLRLPDEDEIIEHFGVWHVEKGKPCPKARISQLFDVLKNGSSLLLTVNNQSTQVIDAFPEPSICIRPLFGPFDYAAHRTVFFEVHYVDFDYATFLNCTQRRERSSG